MAIDNQTNAFSGGMNQDIAPQYLGSPQYRSATDIRIVANNNSTFEAQNIRGDSFVFQFPQNVVGREYSLICFDSDGPFPWTPEIVVTYNTVSRNTGVNTPTSDTIPIGPYFAFNIQQIIDDINAITVFATFRLGDYLDIAVDGCDGTCIRVRVKGTFQFTLGTPDNLFDNTLDSVSVVPPTGTTTFETIPAQSNFQIVGYGSDSESLVLITTSVSDGEPIQQILEPDPLYPRTYGQVWELDISAGKDNIPGLVSPGSVLAPAVHLRYNDQLGLYLKYAFFDEVEVVRENDCTVRVYWTDNFNPPRQVDIGKGFVTLPPSLLGFNPPAKFGPVEFISYVNGGDLKEGMYRFAYRYISIDGNTTAFTPLSQNIQVYGAISNTYRTNVGSNVGLPTDFGLNLRVSNLDTDYQRVQIVAAYFDVLNGIPTKTWITNELEIDGNSSLTFQVFDDTENFGPITIEELVIHSVNVSRAKNLKVVQDRLYVGNFCELPSITLDTSAITYEAKSTIVSGSRGLLTDDIGFNTYNNIGTGGPMNVPPIATNPYPLYNSIVHGQDRFIGTDTVIGKAIDNNFRDYKGPDAHYYRKGYWNDERYRFGILFFAKDGTPYPVKWLTDFDFPATDTTAGTGTPDGTQLFNYPPAGGELSMYVTYLRISGIDVSSIVDDISGFSIVRAKRDKRVIGMGLMMPLLRYRVTTPLTETIVAENAMTEWFDLGSVGDVVSPGVVTNGYQREAVTKYLRTHAILSPELDFDNTLIDDIAEIKVNGYIGHQALSGAATQVKYMFFAPGAVNLYKCYYRLNPAQVLSYSLSPVGTTTQVQQKDYVPTVDGPTYFQGRTFDLSAYPEPVGVDLVREDALGLPVSVAGTPTNFYRIGVYGDRVIVGVSDDLELPVQGTTINSLTGDQTSAMALVTIYNNKVKSQQYNGQGDEALAKTEYMFIGHYQPVDECNAGIGGNYIYDVDVYGGDCMPTIYDRKYMYGRVGDPVPCEDINARAGAYGLGGQTNPVPMGIRVRGSYPTGFIFPTQTSVPLSHRTGAYNNSPTNTNEPRYLIDLFPDERENYILASPLWAAEQDSVGQYFAEDPRACPQVCWPNHIIASERKVFGEVNTDSFRSLLVNERIELELTRGPINHMDILQNVQSDRIYFWQDSGFGFVPINERVAITTSGEAVMGSGTLFGKQVYINRVVGSIHKNSVFRSGRAFYWYDANTQELYRFAADGVTALTNDNGLRSWIRESYRDGLLGEIGSLDNMLYTGGIQGYYDNEHDEAVFMFSKMLPGIDPETEQFVVTPQGHDGICFKEGVSKFTSFYTQDHGLYMPIYGNRIFVTAPPYAYVNPTPDQRYISWKFASDLYVPGASIQFVVNKSPQDTKTLANMVAIMNRLWSLFSIESSPNQKWNQAAVRHLTNSAFYRWQPRGGKWQGPVSLVKNSEEIDLSTVPPTIVPRLEYGGTQMRGEYFLIEYLTNSTEFRTLLAVTTMFHNSQTTR
jgi:hypothetical protein